MTHEHASVASGASLPSNAALRFAEAAAGAFHAEGFPLMPARILMAMTVTENGALTAEQLRELLGVSPASISAGLHYTQSLGLTGVHSVPGERRRRYTLTSDDWYRAVISRIPFYESMARLCREGEAAMALDPDDAVRVRLDGMEKFFVFLIEKFPPLIEEWDRSKTTRPAETDR